MIFFWTEIVGKKGFNHTNMGREQSSERVVEDKQCKQGSVKQQSDTAGRSVHMT